MLKAVNDTGASLSVFEQTHVREVSAEDRTNNSFFRMDVSWLHKKRMQKCWIAFRNCSCVFLYGKHTVRISAARIETKIQSPQILFILFFLRICIGANDRRTVSVDT